jgi:hypothetical protein
MMMRRYIQIIRKVGNIEIDEGKKHIMAPLCAVGPDSFLSK